MSLSEILIPHIKKSVLVLFDTSIEKIEFQIIEIAYALIFAYLTEHKLRTNNLKKYENYDVCFIDKTIKYRRKNLPSLRCIGYIMKAFTFYY